MDDCVFCKILKGQIPCYRVYEDEKVFAFLDINPLSKGHTLVLPKEHYKDIYDIPEDLYGYMFVVAKRLANRMKDIYSPEGVFVNQNNGEKAGQSVFHAHIHVKPMYDDTIRHCEEGRRITLTEEEMEDIREKLAIEKI